MPRIHVLTAPGIITHIDSFDRQLIISRLQELVATWARKSIADVEVMWDEPQLSLNASSIHVDVYFSVAQTSNKFNPTRLEMELLSTYIIQYLVDLKLEAVRVISAWIRPQPEAVFEMYQVNS